MQTCPHSSLRPRGGAPHAFHNSCSQHKILSGNIYCELGWLKSCEFSLEFRLISIKDSRYWLYIKATEKGKKRMYCRTKLSNSSSSDCGILSKCRYGKYLTFLRVQYKKRKKKKWTDPVSNLRLPYFGVQSLYALQQTY